MNLLDTSRYVAIWYIILSLLFIGYAAFNVMQFKHFRDRGAQYIAIMFGSFAVGTFSIAMARLSITFATQEAWFYLQRSSYVGALLGGWWLIDYRIGMLNGRGVTVRTLWRFWKMFFGNGDDDNDETSTDSISEP